MDKVISETKSFASGIIDAAKANPIGALVVGGLFYIFLKD